MPTALAESARHMRRRAIGFAASFVTLLAGLALWLLWPSASRAPTREATHAAPPANRMQTTPATLQVEVEPKVEPSARASGTISVSGLVRDAEGGVIAHAAISGWNAGNLNGSAPAYASSDDQGRYDLRVAPGHHRLVVTASGYAAVEAWLSVEAAPLVRDFRLSPGSVVAGTVSDEASGRAISGALVRLETAPGSVGLPLVQPAVRASEQGTFRFVDVPPGRYVARASSEAGASEPTSVSLGVGDDLQDVRLLLRAGLSVRGYVTASDGHPVIGAELLVQTSAGFDLSAGTGARGPSAITGREGEFVLSNVPAGELTLLIRHPAHTDTVRALGQLIADKRDVRILLEAARQLQGRVIDAMGKPITAARVWVSASERREWGPRLSGPDGRFSIAVSVDDQTSLTVWAMAPQGLGSSEAAKGSADTEVKLDSGHFVDGVVVDPSGRPAAGVQVVAMARASAPVGRGGSAVSDEKGRFHLGPLAGTLGQVRVSGRHAAQPSGESPAKLTADFDLSQGRGQEIRLVVEALDARLTGIVDDAEGNPVDGANLIVAPERAGYASFAEGITAISNSDGRFLVEGLARGAHMVWVNHPRFAQLQMGGVMPTSEARFSLPLPARVFGSVPRGAGVATIQLLSGPSQFPGAPTDLVLASTRAKDGGSFAFDGLSPGAYRVTLNGAQGEVTAARLIQLGAGEQNGPLSLTPEPGNVRTPEPTASDASE